MSHETRDAIAIILIILAAGDVLWTLVLARAAHRLNEASLTERATSSVVLTAVACMGAFLGVVSLIDHPLPSPVGTLIIVVGFVLVSVPQYLWGILYVLKVFK